MDQTKQNLAKIITRIRNWNREWDNYDIRKLEKPKSADQLIDELAKEFNVTTHDQSENICRCNK